MRSALCRPGVRPNKAGHDSKFAKIASVPPPLDTGTWILPLRVCTPDTLTDRFSFQVTLRYPTGRAILCQGDRRRE